LHQIPPSRIYLPRQSSSACRRRPSSRCHPPDPAPHQVVLRSWPSAPAGLNEVGAGDLFLNSGRRRRAWSSVGGAPRWSFTCPVWSLSSFTGRIRCHRRRSSWSLNERGENDV
jgi:hypothetical protein